jgi:outer membrane protein TolC
VVLAVSSLYLEAVAAEARVAALQSQVDSAASLAEQARDMKASGLVARVDVLRAEVQLAAEQQRQIVASNHAATSKLSLARAIGLPLDRTLELVDRPSYRPTLALTPAAALQRALANRADLAALDASLEAARQELRAAKGGGLPSLVAHGDVGRIGPSPSTAETTYTIGAALRVPLFTGGEVAGRVEQAQARITALEARRVDLSQRIELEVRTALLDLGAADARVRVAQRATGVADAQLEQTRDRFAAGVADGVEVVQAQEAVATAHENQIASLLAFNRAQVVLARALGIAADDLAGSTEPGGQP